ncbi:tail protein X [Vogesella sp. GCM10023246]|uniref:Tail protein X n=1 Tax=Vogesella oryzagri TaxID=3160864 RepID=A0ABV1M7N3_9NEIS
MAKIIRTSDGDCLDSICYAHYGHLNGSVEAVLAANVDLAGLAQPYPQGVYIAMPDIASAPTETVTLWE